MRNLEITVAATVTYTCWLSDEDSDCVRQYAKDNDCSLEEATMATYHNHQIDLYDNSVESDFSTECIEQVIDYDEEI